MVINKKLSVGLVLVVVFTAIIVMVFQQNKIIPATTTTVEDLYGTSTSLSGLDLPPSSLEAKNSYSQSNSVSNPMTNPHIIMTTTLGSIEIELFRDQTPNTAANFLKLAQEGFYDGTLFHRVIPGFMVQGGDPLTKSDPTNWDIHGTGGPGYRFADEIGPDNRNSIGTISMANAGPNTNGSQFFINVADNNFLDTKHTVFGRVVSGMEVVQKIINVKTNERDHPLEDVKIEKIELK